MLGLEGLSPEIATDLITLVNSLQKLPKTSKVEYSVQNKNGQWSKKSFSYVPLDNILEKIKENNNFAFMQPIGFDKESQIVGVKCVLIHKSGRYIESDVFPVKTKEGAKIQDEGAEITYRKRYAAGAFFGLATDEDTDGNDDDAIPVNGNQIPAKQSTATPKQKEVLAKFYKDENLTKLLQANGITKLEELSVQKASELIKKISEKKEENK